MESGESYLGILLCDIQVLELNLTEEGDGPPTPCMRICRALLLKDSARGCGLDLTTTMKSPFYNCLSWKLSLLVNLGTYLASVRACLQCLPAEWHLLLGSCRDHGTLGVNEVFGLMPGNMRYNCICKYMCEAQSSTCRIARYVFSGNSIYDSLAKSSNN